MHIGIAFDLKTDFVPRAGAPDDALEEYDSPTTVDAIARVLRERGHEVALLGGGRRFVEAVLARRPDLVFNLAEGAGSRSREAHVPAVCEMLGLAVTHSDPLTMALALDKAVAKRIVASHGVPTPRFALVESLRDLDALDLEFPLFAKPLFEGSSMGIRKSSRIDARADLAGRVETLLAHYREPVLVEEFLSGPEFTVACVGTGVSARVVGVMEIAPKDCAPEDFVYSLERKRSTTWREEMDYLVPPRRDPALVRAIGDVALGAYKALGCRDLARVDVRARGDLTPQFLEANPLPGIAPGWSDLALLYEGLGRTYDDLVGGVVDEASARLGLR